MHRRHCRVPNERASSRNKKLSSVSRRCCRVRGGRVVARNSNFRDCSATAILKTDLHRRRLKLRWAAVLRLVRDLNSRRSCAAKTSTSSSSGRLSFGLKDDKFRAARLLARGGPLRSEICIWEGVCLSYCTSVGAEEAVGVEGLEVPSTCESVASEEELALVCGAELELLVVPFAQFWCRSLVYNLQFNPRGKRGRFAI